MNTTSSHSADCIGKIPLFRTLNEIQKDHVRSYVEHKSFTLGEIIYRPLEKANAIYIINHGKIRIYRLAENGKEQLIRILVSGEFTGELALFKEGIYEAFAEALEDTYICMISHQNFKKLLLNYPEVSTKMLEILSGRLSVSEEQTSWIATETVRERLVHYLSKSAVSNDKNERIVTLNISKGNLSSYLGTTPESLSREWTKLENEGIIKHLSRNEVQLFGLHIDMNVCAITKKNKTPLVE